MVQLNIKCRDEETRHQIQTELALAFARERHPSSVFRSEVLLKILKYYNEKYVNTKTTHLNKER